MLLSYKCFTKDFREKLPLAFFICTKIGNVYNKYKIQKKNCWNFDEKYIYSSFEISF